MQPVTGITHGWRVIAELPTVALIAGSRYDNDAPHGCVIQGLLQLLLPRDDGRIRAALRLMTFAPPAMTSLMAAASSSGEALGIGPLPFLFSEKIGRSIRVHPGISPEPGRNGALLTFRRQMFRGSRPRYRVASTRRQYLTRFLLSLTRKGRDDREQLGHQSMPQIGQVDLGCETLMVIAEPGRAGS